MKKVIIVVLPIVLILIVILVFINTPQKGSNSTQLSDRSKEFLESQRKKGSLDFAGVNSDGSKEEVVGASEVIDIDDCFKISIPFPMTDKKNMGKCFKQILISDPRGMVNVYEREVGYSSLDEDSGVKLRRSDTKLYKKESREVKGRKFIIFKKTDAGYEKTALYLDGSKLISVNLLVNIADDSLDKKFAEMLDSIEFAD